MHWPATEENHGFNSGPDPDNRPAWELIDNDIIRSLPDHLKQYIVDQNYAAYTPIDHAVWRYVLRQNHDFLREYAHLIYFDGLEKTGLEVEHIPSIQEMNKILGKIGWAAVSVNGFIPPAAFMAFQARRVLVIAADMRQIHHIEYTPSPDIIHEAAGHAPVIADSEYAEYLRLFGEIGSKAMASRKDHELYEAIRKLSILKETPGADSVEINRAEKDVLFKQENLGEPSEMARLSRLHWWTVEFGLIGTVDDFKIYGAGLLSSIGESFRCLSPKVRKIPYDLSAADYAFDITTEQPHLFVTPNFVQLINVLEEFASDMAFRVGGLEGIRKAIQSQHPATCQYSSGLQVSGIASDVITDAQKRPVYIRMGGPTSLAYDYRELAGHGKDYHADGFGSPVGRLAGFDTPLELLSDTDLQLLGVEPGRHSTLEFAGGVTVQGRLERVIRRDGKIILMSFEDCSVHRGDNVLFDPSWGTYDMGVGHAITSVFSGAADIDAYEQPSMVSKTRTIKVKSDEKTQRLHELYQSIRDIREGRRPEEGLPDIWAELQRDHSDHWLPALELVEVLARSGANPPLLAEVRAWLESRAAEDPDLTKLINDGLRLAAV